MSRLDRVASRGNGFIARCPAHDDGRPSLKIDPGDDGRVLMHCYAGCDVDAILSAIDLEAADLFESKPTARRVQSAPARETPPAVYDYCETDGSILFQVVRQQGKKFLQRRPDDAGGWIWNLQGVERILYRTPELDANPDQWVYKVEGEKDADRLRRLGILATTIAGGSGAAWLPSYTETLRRHPGVIIIPDNDTPGRNHAHKVASALHAAGIRVKVLALPGLLPKGDTSNWLDAGHNGDELIRLASDAPEWTPDDDTTEATADPETEERDDSKPRRKSLSDQLIELIEAQPGVEFWHDVSQDPYISLERGDHTEHYRIDSAAFRKLAAYLAYREIGRSIAGASLQQALEALQGRSLFDGEQHLACRRIGVTDDAFWLDPCRDDWQVYRTTSDGWQLIPSDESEVRFYRTRGQTPLPEPVRGGSLESLRGLFSLSDDGWLFVRAFLLSNFQERGERPVLELIGSEGSGKTTAMRALVSIFDPNEGAIQRMPKDPVDWFVSARHRTALAIDNISQISSGTSDTMCTISSGITMTKRELFSDADENSLRAYASIAYTSIAPLSAFRSDLVSRCLPVEVFPVAEVRPSQEIYAAIDQHRPEWLGALLDALVTALQRRHDVTDHLANLPRLADLTIMVEAAGPALGIEPGAFVAAVHEAKAQSDVQTLDHYPVICELMRFTGRQKDREWQGSVSDLLSLLVADVPYDLRNAPGWPRQANALSAQLRRLSKALRTSGMEVAFTRSRAATLVTIRRTDPPQSAGEDPGSEAPKRTNVSYLNPRHDLAPTGTDHGTEV